MSNMAEAAVESAANSRFFCHQCSQEIAPELPDYTCPRCQGGFIEQLSADSESSHEDEDGVDAESDPAADFAELWERMLLGRLSTDDAEMRRGRRRGQPRSRIAIRPRVHVAGQAGTSGNAASAIDAILQNLLGGFGAQVEGREGNGPSMGLNFPLNMLHLHGNPGDYVWGSNGLDSIITQLLNQLEGAGPPPAENDKIDNLPKVKVNQAIVDSKTECAVCQDQLNLDEEVRKLPCSHLYHQDCIVPWLKMHDSCPICRLSLTKHQTRGDEPDRG